MEQIEDTQHNTYTQISKLLSNFKKAEKDRLTKGYIEARLECLEKYWELFSQQHNIIISSTSDFKASSRYFLEDVHDNCFENYLDLKTMMKDRLNHITESKQNQTQSGEEQQV
ncbi:hypothetical protein JYU34_015184 [Plutella xylostella]|uniref:Uncharacterized protein n=1 Tax=Plutella xylostella TaxID=51655 RepID=A0ABQ7Q6V3_PLUXY|nr:hypothetical protein JYU34_015184 [Plutella xylostella]